MASPLVNMFTKLLFSSKAVEQGEYPEITMDGFKYAEKVTYATWLFPKASVRDGETGRYIPHLTKPRATRTLSFSQQTPTKKHSVFLFFPSDSMKKQLLNWSLGKRVFLMIFWDVFCSALFSMRACFQWNC